MNYDIRQSYQHFTLVIYYSRAVMTRKITNLHYASRVVYYECIVSLGLTPRTPFAPRIVLFRSN